MRPLSESSLDEPFQSWIDQSKPLPVNVTLLPRSIDVAGDMFSAIYITAMCLVMLALMCFFFRPVFTEPELGPLAFFGLVLAILLGVPLWVIRRLIRTLAARRDQRAGVLRFGIFVGPAGLLVRLVPNRCYPIARVDFILARDWSGGGDSGSDWLALQTRSSTLDLSADHLSVSADQINQAFTSSK